MGNTVRSEFGKDYGLIHEFVVTGRKVGAGEDFYSKLAHDEGLFGRVVEMVTGYRNPVPGTTHVSYAATIMRRNFHGAEDTNSHLGYSPTMAELNEMSYVPFTPEVLWACQNTHILVWLAPLSLMEVWEKQTKRFYSTSNPWYGKHPERSWAKVTIKSGFYLIRKAEVPGSLSKTWTEQQELLTTDEETHSAAVMAQAILIHYLETQERLFESVWVRTSDVGSDGRRVNLGDFDADGLHINDNWDDYPINDLGLASSSKSS